MNIPRPWHLSGAGAATIVLLLVPLFWSTLADWATWANMGRDSGELLAAVAVRGVPHPTGYPTYLLLLHAFDLLPFANPALRGGLLSLGATVGTALCIYLLVLHALPTASVPAVLAGTLAALSYATTALVWSQAVIVEVYSLHTLLVALLLLLLPLPPHPLHGLLIGLALGHHRTILLPLLVWIAVRLWQRIRLHQWAGMLAGVAVGLLVYLLLPWRAAAKPPINWGDASTWGGFWWLVSGSYFRSLLGTGDLPVRLDTVAQLAIHQFGVLLLLVPFGVLHGRRVPAIGSAMLVLALLQTAFALHFGSTDWQVHLLVLWLVLAIWGGWGASLLLAQVRAPWLLWLLAGGGLLLLALGTAATRPQVDARRDTRARDFAAAVWAATPPGAIILTAEDRDTFALWYGHYALRQRPDVAIIAEPLLPFAWYRAALRQHYPWLRVPTGAERAFDELLAELERSNATVPQCRPHLPAGGVACRE